MKKINLSPTYVTALVIILVGFSMNLWVNHINNNSYIGPGMALGMVIAIFLETILLGVIGLIFLIHKDLRAIAQGIFIGLGVNLLIGFSICTTPI